MPILPARVLGPVRILATAHHQDVVAILRASLATLPQESRIADSSEDADRLLRTWQPHLVIVEFGLAPPSSGPWFGRDRLRSTRLPVIAIVPSADGEDRLRALRAGADDALSLPFPPEELALRVGILLRHVYGEKLPFQPEIVIHDLCIDLLRNRVTRAGQVVALTGTERTLLFLLAANAGRVMTRAMIVEALWGQDRVPAAKTVDRHIRSLRVKLHGDWRDPRYIETVQGHGYRFKPEPDLHTSHDPRGNPRASTDLGPATEASAN